MRKLILCLIGVVAVASLGCITHEGQLAILMTSNAAGINAAASQVNVEITSVELWDSQDRVWVTVAAGSQVHELVGLTDRATPLAFLDSIERGTYSQVRVNFSPSNSSVVTDTGRRDPLRIEPDTVVVQSIVAVIEDESTSTVLEMDLGASLSLRGNGNWVLRPILRQVQ